MSNIFNAHLETSGDLLRLIDGRDFQAYSVGDTGDKSIVWATKASMLGDASLILDQAIQADIVNGEVEDIFILERGTFDENAGEVEPVRPVNIEELVLFCGVISRDLPYDKESVVAVLEYGERKVSEESERLKFLGEALTSINYLNS